MSVIRTFRVNPLNDAEVTFVLQDDQVTTKTIEDSYFSFTLPFTTSLESRRHLYAVQRGECLDRRARRTV